jgi:hypothetical protein
VRVISTAVSGVLLLCGLGLALAGCGDSDAEAPSATQLEKAREEGERVASERARVDELEEEVRGLKRAARKGGQAREPQAVSSPGPASTPEEPELLRTFHAPSGNVSCAITSTTAFCTVASIATTFLVEAGSAGEIESGTALPRGSGEPIGFGNTISAGSFTCTIPESDEPKGIVCTDASGHGFEASRVSARQKAY